MALALGTNKGSWGSSSADPIEEGGITLAANSRVFVLLLTKATTAARGGTAPTFGGVDMVQAGTGQAGSAEGYTELWYLINPSLASSTLSIPNTSAGAFYYTYISFTGTGVALVGANQTGTTSGTPSCTVNTVPAGGAVVSVLSDGTKNAPSARSHTAILETTYSAWSNLCQYGLIGAPANVTMSWTLTSDDVAMVMVALKEVVLPITGVIAGTAEPVTGAASGTVALAGSVAAALAPVTAAVGGTVAIAGDIAAELSAVTAAAEGTVVDVGIAGEIAAALAPVTAVASGTIVVDGTVGASLAPATGVAAGTVAVSGDVAAILAPATGVVAGTVAIAGTCAASIAPSVSAVAGTVAISGAIAAEIAAVAAAVAATVPISGDVTANLAQFVGSVGGSVLISGDINAVLAQLYALLVTGNPLLDGDTVKAYLLYKGFNEEEINVLPWTIPAEIIESTVKLHGCTRAEYEQGGLG